MNTFSTLKTSISAWIGQDDLTSYLADFIEIAQARVNATLRISAMESTDTLTTAAGQDYVALPSDFIGIRSAHIDASPRRYLTYATPQQIAEKGSAAGCPVFFTIRGDNMVFPAEADAAYDVVIHYYAKFANLSNSNTSDWLSTNYPQLYLYGGLQAAAEFIQDDAQVKKWAALFDNAIREIEESDKTRKYGPAPAIVSRGARW